MIAFYCVASHRSVPMHTLVPLLSLFTLALGFSGCDRISTGDSTPRPLVVFAAASTTDVINELAARFEKATGRPVRCNFAASSTLARQLVDGAKADVYLSANADWMYHSIVRGVIDNSTRQDLLRNRLVFITPTGMPLDVKVEPEFDFASSFNGMLALGDPTHVPAGMYAREAMVALGWWDEVKDRVQPAVDVRGALRLVELHEAPLGIVYHTDAVASRRTMVAAKIPDTLHQPIVYPIALTPNANNAAAEFVAFLTSNEARELWENAGFEVVANDVGEATP